MLATQAILYSLRGTRLLRVAPALGAGRRKRPITFDFMGASKWFFSMSGVILLIGALAIAGKGINFGIDFEGGTRITAALQKAASVEHVRNALSAPGLADAKSRRSTTRSWAATSSRSRRTRSGPDDVDAVNNALQRGVRVRRRPERRVDRRRPSARSWPTRR